MATTAHSVFPGVQQRHRTRPLQSPATPEAPGSCRLPRDFRFPRTHVTSARLHVSAAANVSGTTDASVASYNASPGNGSAFGASPLQSFQGTETVGDVMTSMVVVATPDTFLGDILEHFAFYTGLPVSDEMSNQLIGMITNIDMYKKQRGKADSVATTRVREVMTSPVVAVFPSTRVSYAAGLMLKYKVHRLPVVDREHRVVGIVTRKDLFQTLASSKDPATESFTLVP